MSARCCKFCFRNCSLNIELSPSLYAVLSKITICVEGNLSHELCSTFNRWWEQHQFDWTSLFCFRCWTQREGAVTVRDVRNNASRGGRHRWQHKPVQNSRRLPSARSLSPSVLYQASSISPLRHTFTPLSTVPCPSLYGWPFGSNWNGRLDFLA